MMDETKLCKIHFVASTIFYPIVLITVFKGLLWSVILLGISLSVALLKAKLGNFRQNGKHRLLVRIVEFLIYNCVFGLYYLVKYLYDKDDRDTSFLFDVSWTLFFSIIALFIISSGYWQLYLLAIFFVGITQNMIMTTNE